MRELSLICLLICVCVSAWGEDAVYFDVDDNTYYNVPESTTGSFNIDTVTCYSLKLADTATVEEIIQVLNVMNLYITAEIVELLKDNPNLIIEEVK